MPDETTQGGNNQLILAPSQEYSLLIQQAVTAKDIDVDKLRALMDMKKEVMRDEAQIFFTEAMTRLQSKLKPVPKNGMIEFTDKNGKARTTPFVKYEDIMKVLKPLMIEEGFVLSFTSKPEDGILVTGTLRHKMGHSIEAVMRLPLDTSGSKNNLQAGGSTITYCRRYIVDMLFDIVREGEDNDGHGAPISDEMVQELQKIIDDNEFDIKAFCGVMKVDSLKQIEQRDYAKAYNKLMSKKKTVNDPKNKKTT